MCSVYKASSTTNPHSLSSILYGGSTMENQREESPTSPALSSSSSSSSSSSTEASSFRPLPLEPHFTLSAPQTSWVFFSGSSSPSSRNFPQSQRQEHGQHPSSLSPPASPSPSSSSSSSGPSSPVSYPALNTSADSVTAQLLTSIGTQPHHQHQHQHQHQHHHPHHQYQQQGTKASDNLASLAFLASVEMRQSPTPNHYAPHSHNHSLASLLSPSGSVLPSVSSSSFSPSSSGLHKLLSAASETPFAPPSDSNPFRPSPHQTHTPSNREAAVRHSTSPSSSSSHRDSSSLSHNHPHQTPSKHHAHAEPASPPSPDSSSSSSSSSASRIKWTASLHELFMKALDILGPDEAIPSKIVKVMNIPGLTRDHVSSHLQKHRLSEKKRSQAFDAPSFDFPPFKKHCPSETYDSSPSSSSPQQHHHYHQPAHEYRFDSQHHTAPSKNPKTNLGYIL